MNRFKGIALAAISSATFGMTPFFSVWLMHAGLSEFEVLTYMSIGGILLIVTSVTMVILQKQ